MGGLRPLFFRLLIAVAVLLMLATSVKKGYIKYQSATKDRTAVDAVYLRPTWEGQSQAEVATVSVKMTEMTETKVEDLHSDIGTDTVDVEVQRILERLDTCLEATNMMKYLKEAKLYTVARDRAKQFFRDLRTIIPKTFNSSYYSPCWDVHFNVELTGTRVKSKVANMTFISDIMKYQYSSRSILQEHYYGKFSSNVVCLPKILVPGFIKCGSTYLYSLMTEGLGVTPAQNEKEPHWWILGGANTHPHQPARADIPIYFFNFAKGTELIQAGHYDVITIDSSVNLIFDWLRYKEDEPPINYCQMPAIIPQVLPDSKFIVVMRKPAQMMYSAFWYSCSTRGVRVVPGQSRVSAPDIFHERVVIKLERFNQCLKHFSLEWCVVNITYDFFSQEFACGTTRIELGIYYVHVHKWLSIIPRERFLFLTMEEVLEDINGTGRKLWKFMGVPGEFKGVLPFEADRNEQKANNYHEELSLQMRKDTEKLLDDFFQPYNRKLVDLLGDPKFLWENS